MAITPPFWNLLLHLNHIIYLFLFASLLFCYLYSYHSSNIVTVWPQKIWYFSQFWDFFFLFFCIGYFIVITLSLLKRLLDHNCAIYLSLFAYFLYCCFILVILRIVVLSCSLPFSYHRDINLLLLLFSIVFLINDIKLNIFCHLILFLLSFSSFHNQKYKTNKDKSGS